MPPTIGPLINSSTTVPQLDIPPVAILLISMAGYLSILLIILIIRQMLLSRGICRDCLFCCGKEDDPRCCQCCIAIGDACDCQTPTVNKCLDSCCPKRNLDCVGFLLCQCCTNSKSGGCGDPNNPCCSCGDLNFNCACVEPDSSQLNCLCCQMGNVNYSRDLD